MSLTTPLCCHRSVNVTLGAPQDRVLMTGLHTVQDAFCLGCQERLGWRYVHASAPSQRYKEGCFIIEKARVYQARVFASATRLCVVLIHSSVVLSSLRRRGGERARTVQVCFSASYYLCV